MTYTISTGQIIAISIVAVWELAWKSVALWRAAKRNALAWFVAILLLNTVGLLPILYILSTKRDK